LARRALALRRVRHPVKPIIGDHRVQLVDEAVPQLIRIAGAKHIRPT
jgi:hypothetical protein